MPSRAAGKAPHVKAAGRGLAYSKGRADRHRRWLSELVPCAEGARGQGGGAIPGTTQVPFTQEAAGTTPLGALLGWDIPPPYVTILMG